MIWEDECYLLSKRKFRENANIINVFTPNKGKINGIVYGGNSRKIRNYLQISNKLFIIIFLNQVEVRACRDLLSSEYLFLTKADEQIYPSH